MFEKCLSDGSVFSSHGTFVEDKPVGLHHQSIDRKDLSSLDLHDVSHQQLIHAHVYDVATSRHIDVLSCCNLVELSELLLLHVVVASRNYSDDHHC